MAINFDSIKHRFMSGDHTYSQEEIRVLLSIIDQLKLKIIKLYGDECNGNGEDGPCEHGCLKCLRALAEYKDSARSIISLTWRCDAECR